jgi:hypothetical protein
MAEVGGASVPSGVAPSPDISRMGEMRRGPVEATFLPAMPAVKRRGAGRQKPVGWFLLWSPLNGADPKGGNPALGDPAADPY